MRVGALLRNIVSRGSFVKPPSSRKCNCLHLLRSNFSSVSTFQPDLDFILNPQNAEVIRENIRSRKGIGDLDRVLELSQRSGDHPEFLKEAANLPNLTSTESPRGEDPEVVHETMWEPRFGTKKVRSIEEIGRIMRGLRVSDLSHFCGERAYYLTGAFADLEAALIRYTLDVLLERKGFDLISVPDILNPAVISSCGMTVNEARTQVYTIDSTIKDLALSGTAEMALAGLMKDSRGLDKVPKKMVSVSRCYRAEGTKRSEERGIYRVHQFTKVEMFAVTEGSVQKSAEMLEEFLAIERELFASLELSFRVLNMPAHELGAPAFKKYDIEAFLPSRNKFGEISSCSNCTDFQSRRLNVKHEGEFCHTVNGTACAVPRMIMALCEQNQKPNGTFVLPSVLEKYFPERTEDKKNAINFQFHKSPKALAEKFNGK